MEARKVEQAAIAYGVEVHALFRLAEGVAQQQREQDAEKCWGEDTALFIHIYIYIIYQPPSGLGSFCRYQSRNYVKQKKQRQKTKQLQIKTNPK